jgi:hypothetical protein
MVRVHACGRIQNAGRELSKFCRSYVTAIAAARYNYSRYASRGSAAHHFVAIFIEAFVGDIGANVD